MGKGIESIMLGVVVSLIGLALTSVTIRELSLFEIDTRWVWLLSNAYLPHLIGSAVGSLFGGIVVTLRSTSPPLIHALIFAVVNGFVCLAFDAESEILVFQFMAVAAIATLGGMIGWWARSINK